MAEPRPLTRRARAAQRLWLRTLPRTVRAQLRRRDWRAAPIMLVGAPEDPELEREHEAWTRQLGEYINSHEEIEFHLKERTFHICRAHAEARRVIASGRIAADFTCPLRAATCPFAAAAALVPGQAIRLKPGTAAPEAVSRSGAPRLARDPGDDVGGGGGG